MLKRVITGIQKLVKLERKNDLKIIEKLENEKAEYIVILIILLCYDYIKSRDTLKKLIMN